MGNLTPFGEEVIGMFKVAGMFVSSKTAVFGERVKSYLISRPCKLKCHRVRNLA